MKWLESFVYNVNGEKRKRMMVILVTMLALVASVMMLPTKIVKARMLPGKSANTFSVYVDAPSGSSIQQTHQITDCVVDLLSKEQAVINSEVFLGMGAPLDYAGLVKGSTLKQGENVAEIVVNLTDKHHREEPSYMMVHRLRPVIKKKCETLLPETSIKMIEQPAGPPTMASVVVEVYGDNYKLIQDMAKRVKGVLQSTAKLVDVDVMEDELYTKYELIADSEKVARSGVSLKQLNQILYLAFEGMAVAVKNSQHSPDQIPLFVVLDKSKYLDDRSREALEGKLSSLRLMNQKGMMVPVNELVDIVPVTNSPIIFSKDLKKMINVIAETDMESQVYPLLEARDKMIEEFSKDFNVTKEPGMSTYMFDLHLRDKKTGAHYLLRWDGEMKVTLDTFRDLGGAFIAALILIFLLLVIYYKSFAISGIILGGSFLSIIGVIIGHWVADLVTTDTFFLTATSLIGFIALMGISSRNSLLLIDFTKSLIKEKGIEKREAIAIATATRAKPIMLTAIAIILGSALLATDPIFGGLGVALISGTVAAVIVSLLFVPVLMYGTKAV
ncbi:MAG TPA: efflux RND transporter permease subunit [Campylobacteraceae bacterium]|nr:efflux RND transporter permease subunit [Campylobacteraceae bacterium]